MKKTLLIGPLAFTALTTAPLVGHASDLDFSANIGFVTEYSFRGIAQSDEGPAVQGGFDATHDSGFYAGIWASNVDFNDGDEASSEIDLYAGYSGSFDNGLSYDIGTIYYAYPKADTPRDYNFWEGTLSLGYDFDAFAVSGAVNYSPDYFNESGDAQYYALNLDVPLPADLNLSAHVGYQDIDNETAFGVPDYSDWSVGLGYSYEGFDLSLQYVDTDLDEPGECVDGCSERVIFGISRSF